MLIKYPRILLAEADAAPGSAPKPEAPSGTGKTEAELAAAQARLAEMEKREKDRVDAEALAAKKAMDAESAKKALSEKDAALKATQEKIAEYEKREETRAMKMLEQLPKDAQDRLTKYKDSFANKGAWYDMIADEIQRASGTTAPAFGTSSGAPVKDVGYTPSKQADEFLANNYMGKDSTAWATKNLTAMKERDEATGQITNKFYIDGRTLMSQVKRGPVNNLNRADALQKATGRPGRKSLGG